MRHRVTYIAVGVGRRPPLDAFHQVTDPVDFAVVADRRTRLRFVNEIVRGTLGQTQQQFHDVQPDLDVALRDDALEEPRVHAPQVVGLVAEAVEAEFVEQSLDVLVYVFFVDEVHGVGRPQFVYDEILVMLEAFRAFLRE